MAVVIVSMQKSKDKVYHKPGCVYAERIKNENKQMVGKKKAIANHYHECKYCAGLKGDVRVHKNDFQNLENKYDMKIIYEKKSDTLFVQTKVGFWKIFLKKEIGEYLLYHRNKFDPQMTYYQAINGEFHRQADVDPAQTIAQLLDYVKAHDKAKVVIMDNYRKLPKSTKKQKKYYKAAEKRERKKACQRVDYLFTTLEKANADMKLYSFC